MEEAPSIRQPGMCTPTVWFEKAPACSEMCLFWAKVLLWRVLTAPWSETTPPPPPPCKVAECKHSADSAKAKKGSVAFIFSLRYAVKSLQEIKNPLYSFYSNQRQSWQKFCSLMGNCRQQVSWHISLVIVSTKAAETRKKKKIIATIGLFQSISCPASVSGSPQTGFTVLTLRILWPTHVTQLCNAVSSWSQLWLMVTAFLTALGICFNSMFLSLLGGWETAAYPGAWVECLES